MVQEEEDSPVAKAHLALRSETDNLEKVAKWCEDNFFSAGTPPVNGDHEDLINGPPSDVQGGERLHQTADYAIRFVLKALLQMMLN